MKITVRLDVQDEGFRHHSCEFEEDQEPFSLIFDPDDARPDRPINAVRRAVLRRVRNELARLIRQAES